MEENKIAVFEEKEQEVKVYITNHYGDKYNSTFKVTYDYDYDSLTYEKTDICIDMPVKER
jgi:hypothetical protein